MFIKILKKDLIKKKTMNVILLMFLILASMFMGSSVNNFAVSTTAVDSFFQMANTADIIAFIAGDEERFQKTDQFMESCDEIQSFSKDIAIMGVDQRLYDADGNKLDYGNSDMRIYLIKKPQIHSLIFQANGEAFEVKDGEIAVPNIFATNTGAKLGDKLTLKIDDFEKEYTICAITKDAGFGTTLGGTTRIVMSDNDYEEISVYYEIKLAFYHVITNDIPAATKAIGENVDGLKTLPQS
jgi:putative ABC transport system permease protein